MRSKLSPTAGPGAGLATALLASILLVSGCGGGGDDGSDATSTAQGAATDGAEAEVLGPATAKESVDDAQQRIGEALASKDCDEINQLNPISRSELSTDQRCAYLRRLDGLPPTGAREYGAAGAVIDYKSGSRTVSAVLIVDSDGLYHVAFLNPFNEKPTVGTKYAEQFDRAARQAVEALKDADCSAYLDVVFRRFGRGSGSEKEICEFVEENPIANLLEAQPDAQLDRAGGNDAYGFYTLGTPGVNMTIVLAREQDSGAPPNAAVLPEDAAEYAYVDALRTNAREPSE